MKVLLQNWHWYERSITTTCWGPAGSPPGCLVRGGEGGGGRGGGATGGGGPRPQSEVSVVRESAGSLVALTSDLCPIGSVHV